MVVVGRNGQDITDDYLTLKDNVEARMRTQHGRDPFQRDYGIGIRHAIGSPTIAPTDIRQRIIRSFAPTPYNITDMTVSLTGGVRYDINVHMQEA